MAPSGLADVSAVLRGEVLLATVEECFDVVLGEGTEGTSVTEPK